MLHHKNGMALADKGVEGFQELLDIVEMKAGCGLIEDEEDLVTGALAYGEEVRQLDSLALTSGKRTGRLPQLYVSKANIHKGLELCGNSRGLRFLLGTEKCYCLVYAKVQDIAHIEALVVHLQDFRLEALAAAGFAHHGNIGHELHPYLHKAVSLAFRAPAALLVEGEIGRREAVYTGVLLLGQELTDVVVDFEVGDGV